MFEQEIKRLLQKATNLKEIHLEVPPDPFLGDYAFPCFELAKKFKKNPAEISLELKNKIKKTNLIEKIEAKGPYLNFFINKSKLAEIVIKKILKEKRSYGSLKEKKKIVIESPGPNTNKPLHLGHLRNMCLGISLSNLFKKTGNKVTNVDIINDRGIHICKSMLAYQKFGKEKKPNKKTDHFVGDYYVLYSIKVRENLELEKELSRLLFLWESGDKDTIALWKKMNSWALKGINETYKKFGMKINKTYKESEHYKKGKDIVLKGFKKEIFKKDEKGAIFVDLTKQNLGKKILLREDGTSIYITQDLYLAVKRYKDFKMDKMIYVVGSEQIHHFNTLFNLLKLLGYPFSKNYHHLAYGMVYLPEGKMKSREGKVVDADNLINEIELLAKKEIIKRHPKITKKELKKRSEILALGAIKYLMLKYDALKDFVFNPEESISFEGETGPYIQYSHARIASILRKKKPRMSNFKNLLSEEEIELVKLLSIYPEKLKESATNYKPSILTKYLFDLAQSFNTFYSKHQILSTEDKIRNSRLALISAIKIVLEDGLNILGIEAPERM